MKRGKFNRNYSGENVSIDIKTVKNRRKIWHLHKLKNLTLSPSVKIFSNEILSESSKDIIKIKNVQKLNYYSKMRKVYIHLTSVSQSRCFRCIFSIFHLFNTAPLVGHLFMRSITACSTLKFYLISL